MIESDTIFQSEVNLGLVFINGGNFGGPEKRFVRIANWLFGTSNFSIHVYISQRLVDWLNINGLVFNKGICLTIYDKSSRTNKDKIPFSKNIKKRKNKAYIPEKLKIIKNIISQNLSLGKWVNENKINLLHGWHGAGEAMFLVKLFKNVKCIYSITSSYGNIGMPAKWFGNLSYKSIFYFMDAIEFLSEDIYKKYKASGLKKIKSKTYIADCSFIDFERMYVSTKRIKITAGAARLEPQKNILLVLEVANILINKMMINVIFDLMVPNDGVEEINKKISFYKLENYFSVSFSKNPAKNLADSLIFLSLQDYNNYPSQLLLEAMSCGCAIVATDVGETRKLVDEKIGLLTQSNANDIASKIDILLKNYNSSVKMGLNARKLIKSKYTIDNYGNYIKETYKNVFN